MHSIHLAISTFRLRAILVSIFFLTGFAMPFAQAQNPNSGMSPQDAAKQLREGQAQMREAFKQLESGIKISNGTYGLKAALIYHLVLFGGFFVAEWLIASWLAKAEVQRVFVFAFIAYIIGMLSNIWILSRIPKTFTAEVVTSLLIVLGICFVVNLVYAFVGRIKIYQSSFGSAFLIMLVAGILFSGGNAIIISPLVAALTPEDAESGESPFDAPAKALDQFAEKSIKLAERKQQLLKRQQTLNTNDPEAVAAFNRDVARYNAQLKQFAPEATKGQK